MTNEQKAKIAQLRRKDCGYKAIADLLGIGKDTVKSYCRRNELSGERATHAALKTASDLCPQCGKAVVQISGMKPRRFCCAECRVAWWNTHPNQVGQKAIYSFICETCGCHFTAYGNQHRKYCSHACYIASRFKGGAAV
ncbi:MAG: RNA polymerase subunit sigma-70 [Ruthenibacterium sp.]